MTKLPPPPTFVDLQRATDELIAACQRGMEAARLFSKAYRLQLVEKPVNMTKLRTKQIKA